MYTSFSFGTLNSTAVDELRSLWSRPKSLRLSIIDTSYLGAEALIGPSVLQFAINGTLLYIAGNSVLAKSPFAVPQLSNWSRILVEWLYSLPHWAFYLVSVIGIGVGAAEGFFFFRDLLSGADFTGSGEDGGWDW